MREIIASIDVGSHLIKLIVAEILNNKMNILCALEEESRGVKNGMIVELVEVEYALKRLLNQAEEKLNTTITKAIVDVPEGETIFKIGEASLTITDEDKEVTGEYIQKVLQMSVKGNVDEGFDLVTVIPIMFKVDDRKTKIPKGMKGNSLSVKSVVISSPKKDICFIAKSLEKCGVEVSDIMIPSIGTYFAHKTENMENNTGAVIDIGYDTTKVAIINKGIIINNLVIDTGTKNIDNDISFVYKLSLKDASKVREELGLASRKNARVQETMEVVNNLGEKIKIDQYELSSLMMSRLHEMLNIVKNEINYLTKKEISYIIVSGGLSEQRDFDIEVESVFGPIAFIGKNNYIGARNNKFASAIGMIKYFDSKLKLRDKDFSVFSDDDLDSLVSNGNKKAMTGDSILGKVFGIFFDN